jgi:hypothetical protein
MKKRILVCGGRDFTNALEAYAILDDLKQYFDPKFIIIEGGAKGADWLGKQWGKARGRPVLTIEAPWDFYKGSAGPIRNQWMIDYAMPDLVVAFPGGSGTRDMVAKAKLAGIDTYEGMKGL